MIEPTTNQETTKEKVPIENEEIKNINEKYINQILSEPILFEQKLPKCSTHETTIGEGGIISDTIYDSVQIIKDEKTDKAAPEPIHQPPPPNRNRLANNFCLNLNCFNYS